MFAGMDGGSKIASMSGVRERQIDDSWLARLPMLSLGSGASLWNVLFADTLADFCHIGSEMDPAAQMCSDVAQKKERLCNRKRKDKYEADADGSTWVVEGYWFGGMQVSLNDSLGFSLSWINETSFSSVMTGGSKVLAPMPNHKHVSLNL